MLFVVFVVWLFVSCLPQPTLYAFYVAFIRSAALCKQTTSPSESGHSCAHSATYMRCRMRSRRTQGLVKRPSTNAVPPPTTSLSRFFVCSTQKGLIVMCPRHLIAQIPPSTARTGAQICRNGRAATAYDATISCPVHTTPRPRQSHTATRGHIFMLIARSRPSDARRRRPQCEGVGAKRSMHDARAQDSMVNARHARVQHNDAMNRTPSWLCGWLAGTSDTSAHATECDRALCDK